jgi:hypothetical protein
MMNQPQQEPADQETLVFASAGRAERLHGERLRTLVVRRTGHIGEPELVQRTHSRRKQAPVITVTYTRHMTRGTLHDRSR